MTVPLVLLFHPEPDPTESFPSWTAEIDGYFVAPDHQITVAVTAEQSDGLEMLDAVWAALRRKGIAKRRMVVLDDRERTVCVMNLKVDTAVEILTLLRAVLMVPIRAKGGSAEVHFLATPEEVSAIEGQLEKRGPISDTANSDPAPPVRETRPLSPEDWAFLGLLSSVGVLDGPNGPKPELLAEFFGVDPAGFARRAREVEHGLGEMVVDLFGASGTGSAPSGGLG